MGCPFVENGWRDDVAGRGETGCDWLVDGFVVGDITEDGTQQRVPLTDAWAVRFEAMARRPCDYGAADSSGTR